MYGTIAKDIQIFCVTTASWIYEDFEIEVDWINAEKDILTHFPNHSILRIKEEVWIFDVFKLKFYRIRVSFSNNYECYGLLRSEDDITPNVRFKPWLGSWSWSSD